MNFDLPPTASCTSVGIRAITFIVVPQAKKKKKKKSEKFTGQNLNRCQQKNVLLFDYLESCETLEERYSYT